MKVIFRGKLIKQKRKMLGLSQRDLAKLTKLKQSNICRWEKSKNIPNIVSLAKIALVLRADITEFIEIKN